MTYVFISYAHEDKDYAMMLAAYLRDHGIEPWMDVEIPSGERWNSLLLERLRLSAAVVVLMTPSSLQSQWVVKEVVVAQEKGIPIMPLSLARTQFPILEDIQAEFVERNVLPSGRFAGNLARIIERQKITQAGITDESRVPRGIDEQRQSDLRLLTTLWETLNSENVAYLENALQQRSLGRGCYNRFRRYRRDRQEKPELKFIDQKLENLFSAFDEALDLFFQQFVQSAGWDRSKENEGCVQPDYRIVSEVNVRIAKEREWEKTVDRVVDVRDAHRALVANLKQYFPEFDFQSEFNCEN